MNFNEQFAYTPQSDSAQTLTSRTADGVTTALLGYTTPHERQRVAMLVQPEDATQRGAAVLFVHWYEPEAADSNRKQFIPDAQALAKEGVTSLLVETMWSDIDFFLKRTQAEDVQNSIEIVVELRQAMDILLSQAGVDPARVAYVGHDFGAMYGTVLGSVDPRVAYYVLMAGTPRFPDWYLYDPALEEPARTAFIEEMQPFDPIEHVANLAPAPTLFQLGDNDPHVPAERMEAYFAAAAEPKEMRVYEAGHGLNEKATEERIAWLKEKLKNDERLAMR